MKKIVAVFTFLLAFSISANAQDEKSIKIAADKDAAALNEYLGLTETQNQDFIRLFVMKHEILTNSSLTQERKDAMSRDVGLKVMASLTPTQKSKLDSNPELLQSLKGTDLMKTK